MKCIGICCERKYVYLLIFYIMCSDFFIYLIEIDDKVYFLISIYVNNK